MSRYAYATLLVLAFACVLNACATSHRVMSGNTNMCINVVNHGMPVPNEPIIMHYCDRWENQQWTFNSNGTITGIGGYCIDVQGGAATDGAKAVYTPCTGSASQSWVSSEGKIKGIGGKCLDVDGGGLEAPVIIRTCNGSLTQNWVWH